MKFTEYLIQEYTKKRILKEELVQGGLFKMFKQLEYWFDFSDATVKERIEHLEQHLIDAGGPLKFSMLVKRIPSIGSFLKRHIGELSGDLLRVAKRQSKPKYEPPSKPQGIGMSDDYKKRREEKLKGF